MFEDEMTEEHIAVTPEDHNRVTQQELHDEQVAVMQSYISALEGQVLLLKSIESK